jgi:hypothetical protein
VATLPIATVVLAASFFPLSAAGNNIDRARYNRDQARAVADAPYGTYEAGYVPSGYRRYNRTVHPGVGDTPTYSEVTYLHGHNNPGDPGPFTIISTRTPASYAPPGDCGYARPFPMEDSIPAPCPEIGRTSAGVAVYWDGGRNSNIGVYFLRIDDTRIAIETDIHDGVQRDQMLQIIDGLTRAR